MTNVDAGEVFDVADTQISHVIVDASRIPIVGTDELTASIYVSNEVGRGGFVEFYMDGSVAFIQSL